MVSQEVSSRQAISGRMVFILVRLGRAIPAQNQVSGYLGHSPAAWNESEEVGAMPKTPTASPAGPEGRRHYDGVPVCLGKSEAAPSIVFMRGEGVDTCGFPRLQGWGWEM